MPERIRCQVCNQSNEGGIAACAYCGTSFDRNADEAALARRTQIAVSDARQQPSRYAPGGAATYQPSARSGSAGGANPRSS